MTIFFNLDKFKDHDLISWLNVIEGKLHSYLIRQSLRYVRDNNVPILITGKCEQQQNIVFENKEKKQPAIETNNLDVGKGADLSTQSHKFILKSAPIVSESKEDIKKRLQNKIRGL